MHATTPREQNKTPHSAHGHGIRAPTDATRHSTQQHERNQEASRLTYYAIATRMLGKTGAWALNCYNGSRALCAASLFCTRLLVPESTRRLEPSHKATQNCKRRACPKPAPQRAAFSAASPLSPRLLRLCLQKLLPPPCAKHCNPQPARSNSKLLPLRWCPQLAHNKQHAHPHPSKNMLAGTCAST